MLFLASLGLAFSAFLITQFLFKIMIFFLFVLLEKMSMRLVAADLVNTEYVHSYTYIFGAL